MSRYVRADRIGKTRREGALKTINKHWGPDVTGFFCSRNESEKTLRQLSHLSSNCFSYRDARRLVNAHVVEKFLTGLSRHSSTYDTTTADWAQLESGEKFPDVSFARLATAANINYGAFGELLEGPPLSIEVFDKASYQVVETHYGRYGELVEGPRPSFQAHTDFDTNAVDVDNEDSSGEKDDDGGEGDDDRGEDEDADDDDDGDDSALDAEPDVDTDVDPAKPEEVEKGVGAVVKSGPGKIVDLKLTGGLVANCLVGTTLALGNPISDTLDEAGITMANLLADVIANPFGVVPRLTPSAPLLSLPAPLLKAVVSPIRWLPIQLIFMVVLPLSLPPPNLLPTFLLSLLAPLLKPVSSPIPSMSIPRLILSLLSALPLPLPAPLWRAVVSPI